ncbi:saccharopine dehydrogenase NADP-binding domain-containing protein [Aquimarina hainanensis]|uniref:Saccharopine dehydrogenase NADP-binding domain-containing protein n=1 Tax=Aquimarina hainanensis TaxID=1578017 RepID=A0ABW5N7U6_9FLAO
MRNNGINGRRGDMIGVIGGYGAVGIAAVQILKKWNRYPLKIGGRNPEKAREKLKKEFPDVRWSYVDVFNDTSIADFAKDCIIIVNCVGPSHKVSSRVAKVCLSLNCHLVDAGIDKVLEEMNAIDVETCIRYGAGMTPGLTGILPQWLASEFDSVTSLQMYTGALDTFTPSGAEDYLVGVLDTSNEPLAAWRDGQKRQTTSKRKSAVHLPFFPREVSVFPFFDKESLLVANALKLVNGDWSLVIDGEHAPEVLNEVRLQFENDPVKAVEKLCMAAALDLEGRKSYCNILLQLDGLKDTTDKTVTALLQTENVSQLTGTITALVSMAVLEQEVTPGIGPAASIPEPQKIIKRLQNSGILKQFIVLEASIESLCEEVEGEI